MFSINVNSNEIDNETHQVYKNVLPLTYIIKTINEDNGLTISHGSGVMISEDGYILTNHHVISSYFSANFIDIKKDVNLKLLVENVKGEKYNDITLVDFNIIKDIAVLKINNVKGMTYIPIAKSNPKLSSSIYSLGNPSYIGTIIERGIFNGKNKDPKYLNKDQNIFYGEINAGMSGGPIVDKDSNMIGLNVASYGNSMGLFVSLKSIKDIIVKIPNSKDTDLTELLKQQLVEKTNMSLNTLFTNNTSGGNYKGYKYKIPNLNYCKTTGDYLYYCLNDKYDIYARIEDYKVNKKDIIDITESKYYQVDNYHIYIIRMTNSININDINILYYRVVAKKRISNNKNIMYTFDFSLKEGDDFKALLNKFFSQIGVI